MPSLFAKWTVVVFLLLATTLLYLDRQALALLAPTIMGELAINKEQWGRLLSLFYYAYTIAQFIIGGVLDRMNLRWAYGVGVLLWAGAVALTGTSQSFVQLMLCRVLLGVVESFNWPGAMRIVARSLPPGERSLGNGIFTSGTSIAALISPLLILFIAGRFSWRGSFFAIAAAGCTWFTGYMVATRGKHLRGIWRMAQGEGHRVPVSTAYREVLATPQFWRVFVVAVMVNPCLYFNLNWIPTFFAQERGIPALEQRWILTAIFLGLDLGYLFAGAGVLLQTRRNVPLARARRNVFLLATTCLALCGAVPFVRETQMAVAVLVAVLFGNGVWIAMYLTMAQEVSSVHISTAAGLLGGSGSLFGALSSWAVGYITHTTGTFAIPMLGITVAAVIAAAAGILAVRNAPPPPAGVPG